MSERGGASPVCRQAMATPSKSGMTVTAAPSIPDALHYNAEDSRWLTPEEELEDLELGWRVSWFILTEKFCRIYTPPQFDLTVFGPWGARHDLKKLVYS